MPPIASSRLTLHKYALHHNSFKDGDVNSCDKCRHYPSSKDTLSCRYVRLELLEGVAAYYSGDKAIALTKLRSSQQRWQQLQVSDERLAELMSMGFNSQEARLEMSTYRSTSLWSSVHITFQFDTCGLHWP